MRDIFLLSLLLLILVRTIGAAQAGILGWTWLTLMTPQKLTWGFAGQLPLNLVLAIVTLLAWFLSREPKRSVVNVPMFLCLAFMIFITFTTLFALAPDLAWPRWSLAIKTMILGLMIASVMTIQIRIHSLIWVAALSLGYYGIKGGLFTILTGGHFRVLAPEGSFGDNNSLALALCMILPLMNYLRMQSESRFVRIATIAAMALTTIGVFGTYSRGGFLGIAIMTAYLWWHSRNRLAIALIVLLIAVPAYKFMPTSWSERMGTIETAEGDSSFQERLQAWRTEYNIATARPFLGGGFNASMKAEVYRKFSGDPSGWPRAAHSIYFEVLGDHGFIGLSLYIALLVAIWRYAGLARRAARGDPESGWIADLASMVQVSLVSFVVAGAALSMAYYDMVYILLGVTVALRNLVSRARDRAAIPLAVPALVGPGRSL